MTNTQLKAERELEILKAIQPDAAVLPFKNEILALCEAFGNSGQSGNSAPFVAKALADTIKKLLLQEPISDITGKDDEWVEVFEEMGKPVWQNKRCSGLFKYQDGRCVYLDAIVWKGKDEYDAFTGKVYVDDKNFELIGSDHYVKFPFRPKTFYIDIIYVPIAKEEAKAKELDYVEDISGNCYYSVIKDVKQLDKVFEYYDRKYPIK